MIKTQVRDTITISVDPALTAKLAEKASKSGGLKTTANALEDWIAEAAERDFGLGVLQPMPVATQPEGAQ